MRGVPYQDEQEKYIFILEYIPKIQMEAHAVYGHNCTWVGM